ncbi:pentatricopeptide repeat-containing protein At5g19020, mitochondrial [Malania oleifera]|uniref:pentatricopeptide repeat-containing protein At5g19020, mitochondrial n=1 Tax=Malania oleifera TaxID=397392 RepID=UPI0025AEAD57|nr:pentatricopeptide repeat-containing protein At5g19020, mitochondrial [Malania oleifera]
MIISLRPGSLLRFIILSPSISPPYLKWLSTTAITTSPPQLLPPEDQLRLFFNGFNDRKQNSDFELALVTALKSCSSLQTVSQGQQIHCLVAKSGLDSNIFVQNSLINMYAKCGLIAAARLMFDSCSVLDSVSCNIMITGYVKFGHLDAARQLFEIMPGKGCVSYTTMIMGLAQHDCWIEAAKVFKDMRYAGVTPNEVTMASVISAYSHIGVICDGRMLHAMVAKLGLEEFVLVSTNLVHMYCLCSGLEDARILFDVMPERNIVSWNVMLNGYSKEGRINLARDLFERIPMKDVVSWGTMIDGYVQAERLREALTMYSAMLCTGLGPNEVMVVDLISACGHSMAVSEGQQLHGVIIRRGFDGNDFIQSTIIHFYAACYKINLAHLQFELGSKDHLSSWNALIAGYIRNGMINQARKIFCEMPERDVFSWSAMISGYAQIEQPDITLELFHEMVASGVQPNEVTMVSVLSSIATLGSLKEGLWAHEYICNNSIPLNDNLAAALIDMYAKCGSINRALDLFYKIRGNVSSVSPWNAIICGLAMHGHADMSLQIFSELQQVHIKLNSITFIGVLSACCHAGLVEVGEQHFMSMKNLYNIDPNIKHYGCMVDLLGRAGRVEEAEELIRSMPMEADVVIWGTLLAACRKHGNVEIGERAAESLSRLDTSHGAGRVLLSNIYADAGRWDDAFLVRKAMQSQRMQRLSGCSGVV